MGLYLCVFASSESDEEIEGVEVGSYDDFHVFRSTVADRLEGGQWASRFPVLMAHSDSDGEWSSAEAEILARELAAIEDGLLQLPPEKFADGWQSEVASQTGLVPASLAECFIDVDGEPLLRRLLGLTRIAIESGRPISFQ